MEGNIRIRDTMSATTENLDQAECLAVRALLIVPVAPPGKPFHPVGLRTVIGTHEASDLVLADSAVSRLHAEIVLDRDLVRVSDLGSKNGTFLDEVAIQTAFARDGSMLRVGRTTLRLDLGAGDRAIPISERTELEGLVGRSVQVRSVFTTLETAGQRDVCVLLTGETGTGKERAAEAIHARGARRDGPFIIVDCGALPPQLLEGELFGHARGAFTGAVGDRAGAFEAAEGGTVFLDEVGELPRDLQPALLRVLDRRQVKRLGENHHRKLDVRVIAATNRDLCVEVNAGRFRADLYYRLAVLTIRLPALRERPDDLPLLVEQFIREAGLTDAEAGALRGRAFLDQLAQHAWPGNIRELRNYLERCVALRRPLPVLEGLDEPGPVVDVTRNLKDARAAWNDQFERTYLKAALDECSGNVARAARAAGVRRSYLYRLLWKHGLR